jgi:glycosyltransferase involved in cell wall biosynthesis
MLLAYNGSLAVRAAPIRIAIDAVPLLVRSAGVKNYLYHWIANLRRLGVEVRLFPYLDRLPELDHEGSAAGAAGTLARQGLLYALNLAPNHIWDWIGPAADIFHATKLLHPPRRARLTATVHDLTCWLMPELHQADNVAAEKRFAERIWKPADRLIAVSENTRQDAVRILGLKPERIEVIYPGVAESYFAATAEGAAKHGLARPYVLYVGTVEPRKNLAALLDAWEGLAASVREAFDLVVAGPEGWRSGATMARLREPPSGVRYLGYVPEADLPAITAGATAFIYPSLYEGFGFPVAQAMAAGVPVITSNVSSLPEITGGGAALIDPRSLAEIRAALERLLTSPSERARLAAAGRIQAQRFRWDAAARQSLAVFEKVLGRG